MKIPGFLNVIQFYIVHWNIVECLTKTYERWKLYNSRFMFVLHYLVQITTLYFVNDKKV